MKLTNAIRDAFVRAAMDDVPKVDFDEQARKLAQDDIAAQMPPKVRTIFADKALRPFLRTEFYEFPGVLQNAILYGVPGLKLSVAIKEAMDKLSDSKKAQDQQREVLRQQLRAVAYSVSTRKALAEALPEFEKYLPADEAAALRTVPVIANVVSDFVKAGWPAGKKAVKA